MNLKMREIIILAVVTLISFPLIFFGVLLYTGALRLESGPKKKAVPENTKIELVASVKDDSLAMVNSKTYQALQQERENVEKEKLGLLEKRRDLELFQRDLEAQKDTLKRERQRIEGLVSKSDTIDRKKLQQLAKVYSAMRPPEAAQIIGTLQDDLAARILDGISDDRQKAKILAALPPEKSTRITQFMGGPAKLKK
jgi:flagellar motility protein MotE (MotC chaperone)